MNRLPKKNVILFDGAMGTYMAQKFHTNIRRCEQENLSHPERVLEIHREYIAAGADAIKTNTFAANTAATGMEPETVEEIVRQGCAIAARAAEGTGAAVFASIGPIAGDDVAQLGAEYRRSIDVFLGCGVKYFLFETFSEYRILTELARYIKSVEPDAFVIAECTVAPDGYTTSGLSAQSILNGLSSVAEIDACGFNCTCGPMHMESLVKRLDFKGKPASIMPNAGYPTVISGRTVFQSTPEYFAQKLMQIRARGVRFLGGCCGTTPLDIEKAAALLRSAPAEPTVTVSVSAAAPSPAARPAPKLLEPGAVAVELDSPLDADTGFFVSSAVQLSRAGADVITIADCPIGRARADSSMLAAKLRREYGLEAMPHLTCRDRNLNATKALLLGLNAEQVNQVLVVTGDPIPSSERNEIKSVFQFNSVRLASFLSDLNGSVFSASPFTIAAALNVNAVNFSAELEKARRKQEAGVAAFLTQPVYGEAALRNLQRAKETLSAHILGGIMPVVSYQNACFINNEIAGITIPESLVERYRGVSKEEAAAIAVETSLELAAQVGRIADGYYLITPLRRVELICEIVSKIKSRHAENTAAAPEQK